MFSLQSNDIKFTPYVWGLHALTDGHNIESSSRQLICLQLTSKIKRNRATRKENQIVRHVQQFKIYHHDVVGKAGPSPITRIYSTAIAFQPEVLHRIMESLYTVIATRKPVGENG